MTDIQKIFDDNKKIHDNILKENEDRRIKYWLDRLDKCDSIEKILSTLYMATGTESNRVVKILIRRAKDINNQINGEKK